MYFTAHRAFTTCGTIDLGVTPRLKKLACFLVLLALTGCSARTGQTPTNTRANEQQSPSSTASASVEASPSSGPIVTEVTAVEDKPTLAAPASAGVVRRGDGWAVVGLMHAPVMYMWSPDTAWVAFNAPRGLWAVSGDGRTEHLLAPGDVRRELAGWWQGALVFLEHRESGSVVAVARPGEPMREVATVPGTVDSFMGMSALYDRYLALFPRGEAALRVDLVSGSVEQLQGFEVTTRCGFVTPSLSGRYLLATDTCEPIPVRLIDMENWAVREVGTTAMGGIWSPVDERWAVLTDGYLAVGDTSGQFRQVPTPHPMTRQQGPVWSADGQHLALVEETGPSPNGNPRYAAAAIWTVSLETGQWRRLAAVASTRLVGWHPSSRYLVIVEMVGAATAHFGLLPTGGGEIEWLPQRPMDEEYATQVDEQLLVVSAWDASYGITLYREVAGTVIPVQVGQLPYKDGLQIRPPYRSWVDLSGSGADTALVVQPLR